LFSLDTFGNTNSASIPITLLNEKKKLKNTKLLISGFGVGLSWGSGIVDLGKNIKLTNISKL
jgi:3-oxoacyl-[acyl-carrier-protein] synthase-3